MKQVVWISSLLVVPLAAWLVWVTSDENGASHVRPSTPPISPADSEAQERTEKGPVVPPREERTGRIEKAEVASDESPVDLPDDDLEVESDDPIAESRRIRLPVIQAIRSKHPTPEARREAMLEALRRSGPSDDEWTKQSTTVFDDWTKGISTDVGLRADWSSAQCYQAGCEVEVSFPDRASYDRAAKEFRKLREPGATHGGRVQTPAVPGDRGDVRASWIMMRPDGSRS